MVLRCAGKGRAAEVGAGRWLRNPRVDVTTLLERQKALTAAQVCPDSHILAIQDTTEINFERHRERKSGLGTVGNGKDHGFFLHPAIAVDSENGFPLGVAGAHMWTRHKKRTSDHKKDPIEAKESYRWIDIAQKSKATLEQAGMVTIVGDRESDIYELFDRVPDSRTHVLARASRNRKLAGLDKRLYDYLDSLPIEGTFTENLPSHPGKRGPREATFNVRFREVAIRRPKNCNDKNASPSLFVTVLDVREAPSTVPQGASPIHWRLITTHAVRTMKEAKKVIFWYRLRWTLEECFRTMKRQGYRIEECQVTNFESLKKISILTLQMALITMALIRVRDKQSKEKASRFFSQDEQQCLKTLSKTLEGKTEKQKNRFRTGSLSWAAWIIARLGGWNGYASERPPGPITMKHGLEAFFRTFEGWKLPQKQAP